MMPTPVRRKNLIWVLSTGFSALLVSSAMSQVSFYGAPAPADFGSDLGNEVADSEAATVEDSGMGLGTGVFSRKPFKFNFSVREGYDSNVFTTSTNPESSFYTNWAAGVNYEFGSSRLKLGASLGGGVTYYYTRPGDKTDFNGSFALNATYLATPRLTLSAVTTTAYLSQPDLSLVGGPTRQSGDYLYSNTTLAAAYQWTEIISTVTSYNFTAFYYLDEYLNDTQGRIEQTVSQSVRWLWKPKTTLVGEYRINPVTYFDADLNQLGNYFLVGFDQVFNPRAYWNLRLGVQVNFNQNPVDGNSTYVGPYFENTFVYNLGPASNIAWNMRYGTEASGITNVTQRQTFRTGLTLTHAFTARLAGTFGMNYQCNYYDQADVIPSFFENIVDVSAGLSFKVNRFLSLQAGYQFIIDVAPSYTNRDYTRNVAFVGANFAF